jgi:acyl carrier protein
MIREGKMTDSELIELMNGIVKLARPVSSEDLKLTSLDVLLKDTGLDSLDFLMVSVYLSDVYGVSEEVVKEMKMSPESTVRDFIVFMQQHKTKEPASVKAALESIQ